mmetsp:Transcript_43892/g.53125  ORF Transcript_43892/g.53125 Transcript_43892/m.53125 type:complete len:134 (-) Transcript_43892:49-450(-)
MMNAENRSNSLFSTSQQEYGNVLQAITPSNNNENGRKNPAIPTEASCYVGNVPKVGKDYDDGIFSSNDILFHDNERIEKSHEARFYNTKASAENNISDHSQVKATVALSGRRIDSSWLGRRHSMYFRPIDRIE